MTSDGCFWFVKWPAQNNRNDKKRELLSTLTDEGKGKKLKDWTSFCFNNEMRKFIRSHRWNCVRRRHHHHQHWCHRCYHIPSLSVHIQVEIHFWSWSWCWCCYSYSYSYRLFSYVTLSPSSSMRWHFVIKFNSTCAPLHFHFHFLCMYTATDDAYTSHIETHIQSLTSLFGSDFDSKTLKMWTRSTQNWDASIAGCWAKWFSFLATIATTKTRTMKKALKPTIFYFYDT